MWAQPQTEQTKNHLFLFSQIYRPMHDEIDGQKVKKCIPMRRNLLCWHHCPEKKKYKKVDSRNIIEGNNSIRKDIEGRQKSGFRENLQDPEKRRSSLAWSISSQAMQSQHTWNLKETTTHDSFQMEHLRGHASTPGWFVKRALRD